MRVEIAPGIFADVPGADELAALMDTRAANPLTGYFPHGKQVPFHEAVARGGPLSTIAFFGGNRSGKTHCSVADDLIQCLPREAIPDHLLPYKRWEPPFHMWIGVPKFGKLEEAIFPKLRELCPPSQFRGGGFDKAYKGQDKLLTFECGSTIGFKTYDQDVDAYSSAELHRMHWDEEPEGEHGRKLRKEARMRLIDHGGDEILSLTPLFGYSWVFEDIYEKRNDPDKSITVIRADIDDNPHLNQDAKEAALADLTEEELKARKSGEFVHFKGRVYDEFSDEKHELPNPPDVKHIQGLDVIEGIDPGIRTTAVVFCAFDGDNSLLVFDELYLHGDDAIPENAAKLIQAKRRAWGYQPMFTVIDPSARTRNIVTGQNVEDAYLHAGIPTIPGQNEVEAGIFEVKRRLQHDPPLLQVSPACRVWLWERGIYRMDDRVDGKFAVLKENDHIMDATRYVAMSRPLGAAEGPREPQQHKYEYGYAPPAEWANQYDTGTAPPLGSMT